MKKLLSITLATIVNLFATTQIIGGISWLENEPSGYFNWQDANSWCTDQGYRLPTISELITVWEASGSTPSPTGFEKNTFYWASNVTSDGHQGCAMDYDCSKNSINASGIPDTGNGHPKCVIDSSATSSSVSSYISESSSSSSSVSSYISTSSSSSSTPTVTTPILVELSSINLNAGWNLISIPGNIKVSTLFNSGDIIYKYINNEWKLYYDQIKSFNEINVGEGFWIKTPTSRTQSVSLTQIDNSKLTTQFGKGWNLIGMNQNVLKENLTFNYLYIYTYNNSKWLSTSEITKLEKYKGYWIKFDQLATKLSDFYLSNESTTIEPSSNKVQYISLKPIDDVIEDELANAILKAQEAITLINITENKFSMGTNIDWRLDYYNMAKSYQQAVSSLQELIDIHEKMETQYTKRVLKNARAYKCDTNIDPYCIPEATHKKIDFYLDHFGETTPKGNKIDIKTIAKQTKQDINFIAGLIKDKYGKVFEKETREAAKWEHYENTAKAISDGADIITAVSGVGTGVKVFKSGFMYATKKKGIMTLFKNQVTRPSSLTDTLYDGLRSKYFTAWSKEMAELAIKSKGNIVKGTWDIGSNVIGLYKKASDFGYVPKSDFVNVTDGLFTIANFAKDRKITDGIKSIMVVSSTIDATKKDIIFLSDTLFEAFSYSDNKDMPNLNKEMLEILYDEDGNLKISMQELTSEDIEKIATELDKKTLDEGLHKGDYEFIDENDVEQKKQVTNEIDLDNVDKEYQKNEIDNSSSEFNIVTSQSSSSSSGIADYNGSECPPYFELIDEVDTSKENEISTVKNCYKIGNRRPVYTLEHKVETSDYIKTTKYAIRKTSETAYKSFFIKRSLTSKTLTNNLYDKDYLVYKNSDGQYESFPKKTISNNYYSTSSTKIQSEFIINKNTNGDYQSSVTKNTSVLTYNNTGQITTTRQFNVETNKDGTFRSCMSTKKEESFDINGISTQVISKKLSKLQDSNGNWFCVPTEIISTYSNTSYKTKTETFEAMLDTQSDNVRGMQISKTEETTTTTYKVLKEPSGKLVSVLHTGTLTPSWSEELGTFVDNKGNSINVYGSITYPETYKTSDYD